MRTDADCDRLSFERYAYGCGLEMCVRVPTRDMRTDADWDRCSFKRYAHGCRLEICVQMLTVIIGLQEICVRMPTS